MTLMLFGQTGKIDFVNRIQEIGAGRMWVRDTPNLFFGERWGFDNGAYSCWVQGKSFDSEFFLRRLDRAYDVGVPELAVVPDIVAEGVRSLDFSLSWADKLPEGWPWYLAVQDGMAVPDVEPVVGEFAGIFLGGTNRFKSTAPSWASLARKYHKRFHYGRAGTASKISHARHVGSDSMDSAGVWAQDRFDKIVGLVAKGSAQRDLFYAG